MDGLSALKSYWLGHKSFYKAISNNPADPLQYFQIGSGESILIHQKLVGMSRQQDN